jgi:hypothetical protein
MKGRAAWARVEWMRPARMRNSLSQVMADAPHIAPSCENHGENGVAARCKENPHLAKSLHNLLKTHNRPKPHLAAFYPAILRSCRLPSTPTPSWILLGSIYSEGGCAPSSRLSDYRARCKQAVRLRLDRRSVAHVCRYRGAIGRQSTDAEAASDARPDCATDNGARVHTDLSISAGAVGFVTPELSMAAQAARDRRVRRLVPMLDELRRCRRASFFACVRKLLVLTARRAWKRMRPGSAESGFRCRRS